MPTQYQYFPKHQVFLNYPDQTIKLKKKDKTSLRAKNKHPY